MMIIAWGGQRSGFCKLAGERERFFGLVIEQRKWGKGFFWTGREHDLGRIPTVGEKPGRVA